MGYKIPTVLNNFNTYGNGRKYVGVAAEVSLPSFENMTETIDGAGIAGEIEEAIEGAFGSLETETTFQNISREYFDFITQTGNVTYRGSMQVLNTATQTNDYEGLVITTRGKVKSFELGSLKKGGKGEPKVVRELTYVKITIGGVNVLELDKFNMIWKLNGVDLLQKIRSQI
ncbi:phage major tail tube protein [Lacrimispora indolis]|uniref:phage major tail tube protein n=1 Tax=Lacrimispora indolis TaxID=69825 RepID=UPI000403F8D8|nr:phage major tail tube protein [[Clostridium] methoxybenzovorans]